MKSVDTNCARNCKPPRHVDIGYNKGDYDLGHYCILIMYNLLAQELIKLDLTYASDKLTRMYFNPSIS